MTNKTKAGPARGKRGKKRTLRGQVMLAAAVMAAVVMREITLLLLIAMLPTIVAWYTDKTKHKARVLAIGAMNLAGATPFVLELWRHDDAFSAFSIMLQWPLTYAVPYAAAALGALIDWATVGAVSAMMFQRALGRLRRIEERQREAAERYGADVSGEVVLDVGGLPSGQPTVESLRAAQAAQH